MLFAQAEVAVLVSAETEYNARQSIFYGLPIGVATVCLPDHSFDENETAIKIFSENEGILEALTDAGIIEETGKFAQCGFATIPIVKLIH